MPGQQLTCIVTDNFFLRLFKSTFGRERVSSFIAVAPSFLPVELASGQPRRSDARLPVIKPPTPAKSCPRGLYIIYRTCRPCLQLLHDFRPDQLCSPLSFSSTCLSLRLVALRLSHPPFSKETATTRTYEIPRRIRITINARISIQHLHRYGQPPYVGPFAAERNPRAPAHLFIAS
jgi:hypothetical protein